MLITESPKKRKDFIKLLEDHADTIYEHCLRLILYRDDNTIVDACASHINKTLKFINNNKTYINISKEDYNIYLRAYYKEEDREEFYYNDMYEFYLKNLDNLRYPEKEPEEEDGQLFYKVYNQIIEEASDKLSKKEFNYDFKNYIISLIRQV